MATTAPIAFTQPAKWRVYFNEVRFELLRLSRTRSYVFSICGFPVLFYLLFGVTNKDSLYHGHTIARYLLAGYACFGAMGSSLFGIGAALALERGNGWLEIKRISPMPAAAYLLAKLCVSITFAVGIAMLLTLLGVSLAGVHITVMEDVHLLLVVAAGVLPFASLGLLIGLLMPANAAPGVAGCGFPSMSCPTGCSWSHTACHLSGLLASRSALWATTTDRRRLPGLCSGAIR
jgi:ABC-2 type transport system permease protein